MTTKTDLKDRLHAIRVAIGGPHRLNAWVNRHGTETCYYRLPGAPKPVQLKCRVGTPEFMAEFLAVRSGCTPAPIGINKRNNATGTWNAAIAAYLDSGEYKKLRRTVAYNTAIKVLRAKFGDLLMSDAEPYMIRDLIDKQIGKAGKGWGKANTLLTVCRKVAAVGEERRWCSLNLSKINKQKAPTPGFRPWTQAEIDQWRRFYPDYRSMQRRAFEILYYFGCRGRSDATRLGWSNTYIKDGKLWIGYVQRKTSKAAKSPILDDADDLMAVLAHCPKDDGDVVDLSGVTKLPWLRNKRGGPFSGADFGKRWREWATAAGLPADFCAHGARKSVVVDATDFGVNAEDGAKITGQSPEVYRHYAKAHDEQLSVERAQIAVVAGRRARRATA